MAVRRILSILAIGMFLSSARPAAAQNRDVGGGGLTVFEDASFRGRNATLLNDVSNLRSIGLNDSISSLRAGPGERWEVCEDAGYRGRCQVFSGSESNLRNREWNDTISSARRLSSVPPGGGRGGLVRGLELYAAAQFSGPSRTLNGPVSDLRRLQFSDRAMSLRLPFNQPWEVCDDTAYRECRVVSSNSPDLRNLGLAQRISSARPVNAGRGGGISPLPSPRQRLVLYEQPGFRGRSVEVTDPTRILSDFMNRAQSLQVAGGQWEICDQMDFGGRCVTVSRNVDNLSSLGMQRRVISVRPARAVPR
jgi:hypothetical protein